jgi:hypothetical protein
MRHLRHALLHHSAFPAGPFHSSPFTLSHFALLIRVYRRSSAGNKQFLAAGFCFNPKSKIQNELIRVIRPALRGIRVIRVPASSSAVHKRTRFAPPKSARKERLDWDILPASALFSGIVAAFAWSKYRQVAHAESLTGEEWECPMFSIL